MGMTKREWEGLGILKAIPAHLYILYWTNKFSRLSQFLFIIISSKAFRFVGVLLPYQYFILQLKSQVKVHPINKTLYFPFIEIYNGDFMTLN